jgi:hypothetical protein
MVMAAKGTPGVVYKIQYGSLVDGVLEGGAQSTAAAMELSDTVGIQEVTDAMHEAMHEMGVPDYLVLTPQQAAARVAAAKAEADAAKAAEAAAKEAAPMQAELAKAQAASEHARAEAAKIRAAKAAEAAKHAEAAAAKTAAAAKPATPARP